MRDVQIEGRLPSDGISPWATIELTISATEDGAHDDAGISMRFNDGSHQMTFTTAPTAGEALREMADRWEQIVCKLRELADGEDLAARERQS